MFRIFNSIIYPYLSNTVMYLTPKLVLFVRWRMVTTVCKQIRARLLRCCVCSMPHVEKYNLSNLKMNRQYIFRNAR